MLKKKNLNEKKHGGCCIQATRFRRSAHVDFNVKWIGTPSSPRPPCSHAVPPCTRLFNFQDPPFRYGAPEATTMTWRLGFWVPPETPVAVSGRNGVLRCGVASRYLLQRSVYQTVSREAVCSRMLKTHNTDCCTYILNTVKNIYHL